MALGWPLALDVVAAAPDAADCYSGEQIWLAPQPGEWIAALVAGRAGDAGGHRTEGTARGGAGLRKRLRRGR